MAKGIDSKFIGPVDPLYTGPLDIAARLSQGPDRPGGVILMGLGKVLSTGKKERVRMELTPEDAHDLMRALPRAIQSAKETKSL